MIPSLDQLNPTTRAAAQAWLDASIAAVERAVRDDVRDDLTIALCEALEADSTPEQLAGVVSSLGPVTADTAAEPDAPGVGRVFGIPYDVRFPTGDRLREALWAPTDPRLLRPRAFGLGWDVNLGALCVRLGLIEPDAEDEPFATTPQDAFVLAAALPTVLAASVVAHYAVRGRALPPRLPNHWDWAGRPDAGVSRRRAATTDLALSVGAAALGALAAGSRSRGAGRAGLLAVAAGAATATATVTVVRPLRRGGWWVGPGLIGGVLGSAGATLLGLALAGRDAERRRDLAQSARP